VDGQRNKLIVFDACNSLYRFIYDTKNNRSFTASLHWALENVQHSAHTDGSLIFFETLDDRFCSKKSFSRVYKILCTKLCNVSVYQIIKWHCRSNLSKTCVLSDHRRKTTIVRFLFRLFNERIIGPIFVRAAHPPPTSLC